MSEGATPAIVWVEAARQAAHTARWATTMAKWGISLASGGRARGGRKIVRWQIVEFPGASGGESTGIVDALAIRKDHARGRGGLKRGDRLEIVLLQIKGGSARMPTSADVTRLRKVKRLHGASHVVLVQWSRGRHFRYLRLKPYPVAHARAAWEEVSPGDIFGVPAK